MNRPKKKFGLIVCYRRDVISQLNRANIPNTDQYLVVRSVVWSVCSHRDGSAVAHRCHGVAHIYLILIEFWILNQIPFHVNI